MASATGTTVVSKVYAFRHTQVERYDEEVKGHLGGLASETEEGRNVTGGLARRSLSPN
jgi:hypothetical protein